MLWPRRDRERNEEEPWSLSWLGETKAINAGFGIHQHGPSIVSDHPSEPTRGTPLTSISLVVCSFLLLKSSLWFSLRDYSKLQSFLYLIILSFRKPSYQVTSHRPPVCTCGILLPTSALYAQPVTGWTSPLSYWTSESVLPALCLQWPFWQGFLYGALAVLEVCSLGWPQTQRFPQPLPLTTRIKGKDRHRPASFSPDSCLSQHLRKIFTWSTSERWGAATAAHLGSRNSLARTQDSGGWPQLPDNCVPRRSTSVF